MPRGMGRKWWCSRISERGYRITVPRQEILKVLCDTDKHLSAEDIYHRVHECNPNIGLTTVYRTLELLVNMNMIQKLDFGEGRSRYELSKSPSINHHHHLICKICGRIIDYKDYLDEEIKMVKKIELLLEKKHNFKIDSHQLHFYGFCKNCK